MTQYNYIVLTSSDDSITGKFTVIQEGYSPRLEAIQMISETIEGGVDIQVGSIITARSMIIKCRHTESRSGYGSFDVLKSLYLLRNPKGTPSNIIKYTDHQGIQYQAVFDGAFQQAILAHQVEGTEAWFLVNVTLRLLAVI